MAPIGFFWPFFYHLLYKLGPLFLFIALSLGIVGLPLPDEFLLTTAGYLTAHHKLNLAATLSAAILGSVCGITLSYLIGRVVGRWALKKFGPVLNITPEHLEFVKKWFRRVGKWVLVFGYFIPIFRHLCGFVAGGAKLKFSSFALYAYSGAFIWSLTFLSIGYYSSSGFEHLQKTYKTSTLYSCVDILTCKTRT